MRLLLSLGVIVGLCYGGYFASREGLKRGQEALLQYNLKQLANVREAVARYAQAHGKYPDSLTQAGPVPSLTIVALGDATYGLHWHMPESRVAILKDLDRQPLDVDFMYRGPASRVTLVGDFNNFNPQIEPMNHDETDPQLWKATQRMDPGNHTYGISIDGAPPRLVQADIELWTSNKNFIARSSNLQDTGGWAYDPANGRVFIACSWTDSATGRPLFSY